MNPKEMSHDQKTINLKDFEIPSQQFKSIKIKNLFNVQQSKQINGIFFDFDSFSFEQQIIQSDNHNQKQVKRYKAVKIYEFLFIQNNKLSQIQQTSLIFQLQDDYSFYNIFINQTNENSLKYLILTTFDKETYFINDFFQNVSYRQFSEYFSEFIQQQQPDKIIGKQDEQEQEHQNERYLDKQKPDKIKGNLKQIINNLNTEQYLKSLTNIKSFSLEINSNILQDNFLKSLSEIIITYSNLQILDLTLSLNFLSSFDLICLGNTLPLFQKLDYLKLNISTIFSKIDQDKSNDGWNGLFHGISQCKSLIQFTNKICNKYLNDIQIQLMMKHICNMLFLKKLKLDFSRSQMKIISDNGLLSNISNYSNIEQFILKLDYNEINEENILNIQFEKLNELKNLRKLKLYLNYNNIGIIGCEKIKDGISQLTKLETLNLNIQQNQLGQEGFNYLIIGITSCINLINVQIDFSDVEFSQKNIIFFGEQLIKLVKLQFLDLELGYQELSYECIENLIKQINKLQNLKILYIQFFIDELPQKKQYLKNILMKKKRLVDLLLDCY